MSAATKFWVLLSLPFFVYLFILAPILFILIFIAYHILIVILFFIMLGENDIYLIKGKIVKSKYVSDIGANMLIYSIIGLIIKFNYILNSRFDDKSK